MIRSSVFHFLFQISATEIIAHRLWK